MNAHPRTPSFQYLGPIRNAAEAERVATILERAGITNPRFREIADAAILLRRNWHAIAARPAIATRVTELAASLTHTPMKG